MKEKNKTYTAAEIARYHQGTMPPGEMHLLEKAALEDPFLADALEGYAHMPDVKSDIEELEARLAEKREKKNIFSLSSLAENKWWRIAALFIVVAGAGYFFYQANYNNKEISLASIKNAAPGKENAPLAKSDTIMADNTVSENQQVLMSEQQKEKTALQPPKSPIEKKDIARLQKAKTATDLTSVSRPKNSSYADSTHFKEVRKRAEGVGAEEYVLKGAVIDETGSPVPYATIKNKTGNIQTFADESGQFVFKSQDSSVPVIASAAGYASKSFNLKKDIQPTVEIRRNEASLSEVVVTAMGARKQSKKTASASKALNGKIAGVAVETAKPQPSGGFEKFSQYLKENTLPVYDEKGERVNGEVLLSFTINRKGKPENIKVVKSSCAACEEAASRLLQNGPKWIGKKDEKGTAVIEFFK